VTTRISAPTALTAVSAARARRSLLLFATVLLPLSVVGYWFMGQTRTSLPLNLPTLPLMLAPGLSALVTRLALREGFADLSLRLGGGRGRQAALLGLGLPLLVGALAYGGAHVAGVVRFTPAPATAVVTLALAATLGTLLLLPGAAGEEIGWRGHLLPRLIEAELPCPILLSGLVWGAWHLVPLFSAGYAAGPVPFVSAAGLVGAAVSLGAVLAWMRLDTGSIWPGVVAHAAWNATVNGGFDLLVRGGGERLWVGESGVLVVLVLAVVTVSIGVIRRERP
jgi:uncharacterized protein